MANEKWKILFFTQHSSLITLHSPAHSTSQARHYRDQLVGIDWLGNVSAVTGHYCLHAILDSRVSSQRHGGNALIFSQFLFANSPDQFVTIAPCCASSTEIKSRASVSSSTISISSPSRLTGSDWFSFAADSAAASASGRSSPLGNGNLMVKTAPQPSSRLSTAMVPP